MLWTCDRDVSLLGCQTNIFQQMTILLPEAYTLNCIWISDLKRKPFICFSFFLFFFVPFSCDTSSWCNLTTCTLHEGIFVWIRWKFFYFFKTFSKSRLHDEVIIPFHGWHCWKVICALTFGRKQIFGIIKSFCFVSWFFF